MAVSAALVVTTINDLAILDGYLDNFTKYEHLDHVQAIVIPDRKTPPQVYFQAQDLSRRGLRVHCPSLEEQETFLKKVGFPPHLIPYDSDNRRNVGYLLAVASGFEFIISIDDDNYCRPDYDFFQEHAVVCRPINAQIIRSSDGWFNCCSLLKMDKDVSVYPRGFPYFARHKTRQTDLKTEFTEVHINAGLWLVDPDLDGITWLVSPARSQEFSGPSVVLDRLTWAPVNTQNTSLRREAVAAYYFLKMGYEIPNMPSIDRYGDIFSGYFIQACAKHLGYGVRFGTPVVDHRRNAHNYFRDATKEWACIIILEDLLQWLTEVKIQGSKYVDAYISLSHSLEDAVEKMKGFIWSDSTKGYFHQIAHYMRIWAETVHRLL